MTEEEKLLEEIFKLLAKPAPTWDELRELYKDF